MYGSRRKKILCRVMAALCAAVLLFGTSGASLTPVYATSGGSTTGDTSADSTTGDSSSSSDAGSGGTVGSSLYDVSTALTAYINNVVGPNGNDKHNDNKVEDPKTAGNAGGYVGYGDAKKQKFEGFITSTNSHGASGSTYDAWEKVVDGSDAAEQEVYQYVRFGKTLADAGLDETGSGAGQRHIAGVLTQGLYALSEVTPKLFGLALKLLKLLNPFNFLETYKGGVVAQAMRSGKADAANANGSIVDYSVPAALQPLINFISGTMNAFDSLSWYVVVPMLIALLFLNIFILRANPGSEVLKFVKRVVFIAIGIPLFAELYTSTLYQVDNVLMNNTPTTKLVSSSFVDYESWVNPTGNSAPRMSIDGLKIESAGNGDDGATNAGGAASADMLKSLRNTAGTINKNSNDAFAGISPVGGSASDSLNGGIWDKTKPVDDNGNLSKKEDASTTDMNAVFDLVSRYQSGSYYDASAYNSVVAASIPKDKRGKNSTSDDDYDTMNAMFSATDEVSDWMNRETEDNKGIWNGSGTGKDADSSQKLKWAADSQLNIFDDGTLKGNGTKDSATMTWSSTGAGFSRLAMYNYLSTSFDDASLVVYSPANSNSGYTMRHHYSVTLVGSGVFKILYFFNMIVCIGALGVIALTYSFGMVINNLKRGIKLLVAIPGALLGVLKSIAQVILYAVMMICEVIGSAFLYTFFAELFVVLASVLETLVTSSSDGIGYSSIFLPGSITEALAHNFGGGRIMVAVMIVVEILMVLGTARVTMKYRRSFFMAYELCWRKAYRSVTFNEFLPVFDGIMDGMQDPYPWDTEFPDLKEKLLPDTSPVPAAGKVVG